MRRAPLYSSSARSPSEAPAGHHGSGQSRAMRAAPTPAVAEDVAAPPTWRRRLRAMRAVRASPWLPGTIAAIALLVLASQALFPARIALPTQDDIDAAVMHTLQTRTLPSAAARAWQQISPSVVRVRGLEAARRGEVDIERNVGTGVVILDTGAILTNLHVVAGVPRIRVEFADGSESDATLTSVEPAQDLAVLQARTIPDDLAPATLRSSADLAVGDEVVAVGYPFGIGPTASAGIVSGLRREFTSPEGKRLLTNLIQFDAAVNPGNSGGPLVTADGEVVGIVTAIMNPTEQRVFIGIGFAVPIETAASAVGMSPF